MKLSEYLVSQILETENGMECQAVIPGSFSPPTLGHFYIVNELSKRPEVDKVLVLVSPKEREGINKEDKMKVWDIYKKHLKSNVEIKVAEGVSPINDIHELLKNNPNIFYLLVVGKRSEEDEKDLKRFKTVEEKYKNFKIVQVNGDLTRATNARKEIKDNNFEAFQKYLPVELNAGERKEIWDIVNHKENIKEDLQFKTPQFYQPKEESMDEYLKSLKDFIQKEWKLKELPKITFIDNDKENADKILGLTAFYEPTDKTITVYTLGRDDKSVLRSIPHECYHFVQDVNGRLKSFSTDNINQDQHLAKIEKEAYAEGDMLFRKWSNLLTNKND